MDLEEQTLRYYSKVFSIALIAPIFFSCLYIFNIFNKKLILNHNPINIKKGENLQNVFNENVKNFSNLDFKIVNIYFKLNKNLNGNLIHYGKFNIKDDSNLFNFIKTISQPSNIFNKITIVEGWSKKQLDIELSKYFKNFQSIPYNNLIADTYFIQKNINLKSFLKSLSKEKQNYFEKFQNNKLLNNFTQNEIMILGSLLEKEGLDEYDKKKISSVLFNRLNKNMKLQIDATVLFALTKGEYNLGRKLLISDLKINHPYNTYVHHGLPPEPISYVGKKTLDILFENYETDFLFYFFNKSLNKHIFSKTFKEHKEKLNEYRNKK